MIVYHVETMCNEVNLHISINLYIEREKQDADCCNKISPGIYLIPTTLIH